jgi:hypothetical protein
VLPGLLWSGTGKETAAKALPRPLKARCEALTRRHSDPNITGPEEETLRAEVQRIIEQNEAHRAEIGTMMRMLGERKLISTTDSNCPAPPD